MDKIQRQKQKRSINKKNALEFLGSKCANCGSIYDLQFDHINRETKVINISKLLASSWETILLELSKCQLLCGPCHRAKTIRDLEHIPAIEQHGTLTSYTHGKCRCSTCKTFWNAKTREYKSKAKMV